MRGRTERFIVLPFSTDCTSQMGIAVANRPPKKSKSETNPPLTRRKQEEESKSREKMKKAFGILALPKPNVSSGIRKLIKCIKSFSQVLAYKEETKEMETDNMEIGFPTDVKHVTHVGLDGNTTTNPLKSGENLKAPEIISFPSISLRQFELAMVSQAHGPFVDPSKLV